MSKTVDRSSSDAQDSFKLLKLLNSLEQDLESPYLERKTRSNSYKSSPLEELQDAIQEIVQREKDLQATIGISKLLIDNNEELVIRIKKIEQDKVNLESTLSILERELSRTRAELLISEEKYQNSNSALIKSESENLKLISQSKKASNESKNSPMLETISLEKYDNDINELTSKFKHEYEYILKIKLEAEKKNKVLEDELKSSKELYNQLENQFNDISKKYKTLEKNHKKNEEQLETEMENVRVIEIKYDEIYKTYQSLIIHAEKQEEELEILKNKLELKNSHQNIETYSVSLKNELEDLEENFDDAYVEASEAIIKKVTTLGNNLRNSFKVLPRTLGLYIQSNILIEPKKIRKNPTEEYFTLITQAIKLNSPYMDTICVVSPKTLYETAVKNDVPFHKWHLWVEKQLNSAYLQSIYKSEGGKGRN